MRLFSLGLALGLASAHDPITYGSAVKLLSSASVDDKRFFLSSLGVQWNGRPEGVNVVTTMLDEAKPEVYWTITSASDEKGKPSGLPVKCGSTVRLLHAMTRKYLHANRQFSAKLSGKMEAVTAGSPGSKEKADDFVLECNEVTWEMHSQIRLKHVATGEYLASFSSLQFHPHNCPGCPMIGHREAIVSSASGSESYWSVEGGIILNELIAVAETRESVDDEDLLTSGSARDEL